MARKFWIRILPLIGLLVFPPAPTHATSVLPFAEGERLIYNLTWFGMNVGTGILEVESRESYQGRDTFRIVSTARSNNFISFFFPVEDQIESIVDANEIYSYRIHTKQHHGSRHVNKEILFDQENHQATMIYKGKTHTFSIPPRVQDSLSSLYFFRTFQDLSIGQSVFIDVHESKKNWQLEIQILGREQVSVPMGTFDTIKVKAGARYEGVLMNKGDIDIWVTDDEHRIPVMMKGRISIGPITASLVSGSLPSLVAFP